MSHASLLTMFWWTLENLFCDRMILLKSVMRIQNVLVSHASLLTMFWWTSENLFCDRMIINIKICDDYPEFFDVTYESFDYALVDIRKFIL